MLHGAGTSRLQSRSKRLPGAAVQPRSRLQPWWPMWPSGEGRYLAVVLLGRGQAASWGAPSRADGVVAAAAALMVLVVAAAVVAAVAGAAVDAADRCDHACLADPSTPGTLGISGLQVIGGAASRIRVPAVSAAWAAYRVLAAACQVAAGWRPAAAAAVPEDVVAGGAGWLVEAVGQAFAAAAAEALQNAVVAAAGCHVGAQAARCPLRN